MKKSILTLLAAGLLGLGPAQAADLFNADGRWIGTGSLARTVDRAMQPARCEVNVEQKSDGSDVSVTGRCVLGAGDSNISMRIVRDGSGGVRGAMWAAATGETLQLSGSERDGAVNMSATSPWVVDGVSYETMITVREPDTTSFATRQLVRGPGETSWRVIVDMTYRQP